MAGDASSVDLGNVQILRLPRRVREARRVFYRRTSTRGDLTIEVEVEMEGFDSGQCVGIVASLVDESGPQD